MGKKYYCDYCDKTMVATPSIIRTHLKGVVHLKLVSDHYQQYKDPETILNEESLKKPCSRFLRGECNFGGICRYSHYTQDQILALKKYVSTKNNNQSDASHPCFEDLYQKLQTEKCVKSKNLDAQNSVIYDSYGVSHTLPWAYNPLFDSYGDNLPPSIRRFKSTDFSNACFMEWGWS